MTKNLKPLFETLLSLPPPKKILTEADKIECLCGHWKPVTEMSTINTGVVEALNNVCPGCREGQREDKKLARIVCIGCKQVIARMVPHKDPRTGFLFEAGRSYHVESCPSCNPGIQESWIIEKKIYDQKMRRQS